MTIDSWGEETKQHVADALVAQARYLAEIRKFESQKHTFVQNEALSNHRIILQECIDGCNAIIDEACDCLNVQFILMLIHNG